MGRPGPAGDRATTLTDVSGGTPGEARLGERGELGIDGLSEVTEVGTGGSSTVYRARQDALDREVAVKVVHAAWTMETRERFEHERELMGRLSGHTAIVPIFETGITRRGEPFLLMPYYARGSLFRLIRHRGPLPWTESAFLIETVALTLADCHREGIVHRDVKPGNVMLTRHLHPRLADFGIALPRGMATSPATVAFTPSYSPPEAFEPGTAEPTVDVYGLGATLWALLAGGPPHAQPGSTDPGAVRAAARLGPPPPPGPDTPGPIVDLLNRSLAPDPGDRPPDADAFLAELRRAARRGPAGLADRASPTSRRGASPPSRRTVAPPDRSADGAGSPVGPPNGPGREAGANDHLLMAAIVVVIAAGLALIAVGAAAAFG